MTPSFASAGRALLAAAILSALATAAARAEDEPAWKTEFAEICSKTQDAMTLTDPELESLIARGEKIAPVIEQLGEVEKKVYSRRLRTCLDLYRYVLETRRGAAPK